MEITDNPNYYFGERPYKSKYICTKCKKSFKRKLLSDITLEKGIEEKAPKCPNCSKPTSWIGPKFKAPKTDNIKAWDSIKALHDIGLLNFIGWANGYVEIPETKKSLTDLLKNLKEKSERNIKQWTTADYSPDNKTQIKYFSEALKRIEKYL